MRAYTDKFVVRPDGIYCIEKIYHPGGDWEQREVLWLPRSAVEDALELWKGNRRNENDKL